MSDLNLDELAEELAAFDVPERRFGHSPREERIITGFGEIQAFVEKHGRAPQHGEGRDIFERLYAMRLDRLRALDECRTLLARVDRQGLLSAMPIAASPTEIIDEDELFAELSGSAKNNDITSLRHVRTSADRRAAEEIAQHKPCQDFDKFKPLFERVRRELNAGVRQMHAVHALDEIKLAEIQQGEFFIVEGQLAYVAEVGEEIRTKYERKDSRLRVLYDNGTESDVLQRSFQRALHRDPAARLVTNPNAGPLFSDEPASDEQESGTIYVARSRSELPIVAANRDILHKIGVTGGNVAARVASARFDPTFLLAEVAIVATYDLYNINRVKLENLIHRVFDPARLHIEIRDRFGNPVVPREWFLVPLFVVNETVDRIKDGTIVQYIYDPRAASLVKASSAGS